MLKDLSKGKDLVLTLPMLLTEGCYKSGKEEEKRADWCVMSSPCDDKDIGISGATKEKELLGCPIMTIYVLVLFSESDYDVWIINNTKKSQTVYCVDSR